MDKLEACKWCAAGDRAKFLDSDGTLVSITGNDGILSHAYEDSWWPCLKFGVELHCSRASVAAPDAIAVIQEWRDERERSSDQLVAADLIVDRLKSLSSVAAPVDAETTRFALSGQCDNDAHSECPYPEKCRCSCHVDSSIRAAAEEIASQWFGGDTAVRSYGELRDLATTILSKHLLAGGWRR